MSKEFLEELKRREQEEAARIAAQNQAEAAAQSNAGFAAPAQMESVVDTVGQAPAVESPFSQQAAAATDPLATPVDLSGTPAVQAPPSLVTDNPFAPSVGVSEPTVPQDALTPFQRARIEDRLARTNADIVASGETVPSLGTEAPKEGFMSRLVGGLGEQFTQPAPLPRQGGGAEAETAFGATPTQPTLFREGLSALSELNKTPLTSPDSFKTETPSYGASDIPVPPVVEMATPDSVANLSANGTNVVTPEAITAAAPAAIQAPELPQQPLPPVMDGSQIPKPGEEGFKFAERGSPQDYFLSQTNDGTTPLSPEQIARGQEYAKQQGLNFDPTTGFSQNTEAPEAQAPQVQAPQGLTTAGGQPLAEFLAGGQQLDAQGRMIDPNVDRSSFEKELADREARQAARPDFGEAQERAAGTVTDRERRAARGEGMSDADRRDIAKANQRGASAGDIARGDKVAALNNIDRKTGEPLVTELTVAEKRLAFDKKKYADILSKEAKGIPLTPSELLQREKFEYLKKQDETKEEGIKLENQRRRQIIAQANEPDATSMQKKKGEWEEMKEDMVENNMPEDEIAARRKAFLYGDKFDAFLYDGKTSNKGKAVDEVTDATAAGSSESEYTSKEERYIQNVINKNAGASREDAIKALEAAGKITKKQ